MIMLGGAGTGKNTSLQPISRLFSYEDKIHTYVSIKIYLYT